MKAEGTDRDAELVLAAGDTERCSVLVLLLDLELHIGHREIELGVETRAPRLVHELLNRLNVRQRFDELHRDRLRWCHTEWHGHATVANCSRG